MPKAIIYRVRPGAYGCRSAEIYDNEFAADGAKMGRPQGHIMISGGVVMAFGNQVTGKTYNTPSISLSHDRAFQAIGEFGICDGKGVISSTSLRRPDTTRHTSIRTRCRRAGKRE